MGKRIKILCSIAVATVFLSASPASAQTLVYNGKFFTDGTHTTQVGYTQWIGCDGDYPILRLVGTWTVYDEQEPVGYCDDGQMQPL